MLAAVCAAALGARSGRGTGPARVAYPLLLAASLGLMVWTADGGGAITHGDGYLTDKMPARLRAWLGMPAAPARPEVAGAVAPGPVHAGLASADPSNPAFYAVHIAPLLSRSCVSCHRAEKHKGTLRLDTYEQLMRGGEDGKVVVPGNPRASDMIRRLRLPPNDDDSMPSDGEKPFTPEETQMVERWIAAGAKGG
jgi:Planctomycete cytochrome C